ncbi:MAG: DUF4038 domain-containing protein [Verrucomicrobia bacterium]|nr:DUF4038 domain-containing protein [Verrucomicrobiota bacterium]
MRVRQHMLLFTAGVLLCVTSIAATFPLKKSANGRYLVDQKNVPFPILGRTAWFVISLTNTDYQTFITDSVSRGYNSIEMHVLDHDPRGNQPPFNGNGDLPFLKRLDGANWSGTLAYSDINSEAPDFSTPNEAYWSYVDSFLNYCDSKGVVVFFFPSYVGYQGADQGWMQEMTANGAAKMNVYGAFLANRYKNQKNLIWMMGGDDGSFTTAQADVENALLSGLTSVPQQQSVFFSAEWASGMNATDQSLFGSLMSLNGVYNWAGDVSSQGRQAYSHSPVEPAFLLEEPYDQEGPPPDGNGYNPSATQPVRRFQWWGWLSAIGGYISGNGYVWPFNAGWRSHLNTQGSRDMGRLNAFINSVAWFELVPSGLAGMRTLVTAGGGTPDSSDYVAAAATSTGSLLVAYLPPGRAGNITVDLTVMSGSAQARWYDPTSGNYTTIPGSPLANTGPYSFTPPGNNSVGDRDWVLLLETTMNSSAPTRGSYNGLFYEDNAVRQSSSGFFTLSTTTQGTYSGRLQMGTSRYSISGQLDAQGQATNVIQRPGASPLTVELQGGEGDQADQILGRITDGTWVSPLLGERVVFDSKTYPAPFAGSYTLLIPPDNDPSVPAGDGFGTVRVSTSGAVRFGGVLADGTKVTQGVSLSKNGDWPLYVALYSGKGAIVSWLRFTNQSNSDLDGKLSWIKPAGGISPFYPAGFTNECDVVGSVYVPPVGGSETILNLTNALVEFTGGNLAADFTNSVTLAANNRLINQSSNRLTMSFSLPTGTFKGGVTDPASAKSMKLSGVVLQKANIGGGLLLGTNQSSRVVLTQ